MKGRPFLARMGFALAGLRSAWSREASFRSQTCVAAGAALTLLIVRPNALWVAAVVLAATSVLALEAANAAIEELADTLHPGLSPGIGRAKDMAAAAVLIASIGAAAVGCAFAYGVGS
jgi:diacylglycerol kinase